MRSALPTLAVRGSYYCLFHCSFQLYGYLFRCSQVHLTVPGELTILYMLDGRDDVEALTRVLDGLQEELSQQREEINDICLLADEIGGLEPLDVDELQTQLEQESQLTQSTMDTLIVAEQELESIMKMVREFSRVQTIKSLSLQKECSDQITEWSQKVDKEYMELIKFHEQCMGVDRKLAKLAAHYA